MTINRYFGAITWLATTSILIGACSSEENQKTSQTKPVVVSVGIAQQQVVQTISISGKIESNESALISTRIMGFITSIPVKAGHRVQKGQLVATISNAEILAKRAQAQAMLTEAETALRDAKKDYERYEILFKQQSASTKEFENVTLQYNSLKTKVEAAQQMRNEADAMLAYTNLVAPFTGVIVQTMADAGSMANPGMPLMIIEQQGGFQVKAAVTEADIDKIKLGDDATVLVKSLNKQIKGKVTEASPSSQFSGGQYQITISITESISGLYSGMFVQVVLQGNKENSSATAMTLVPSQALVRKDQLVGLYTVSENKTALLRWVRIGKTFGEHVEILSGLKSDEKFIIQADGKLYNGVPVQIQ